ncbi:MAG TPA: ADP-ribosylglycohydrolase family protein [Streptosporangiaceae bacterium]|nr:ADP-ribosylglycohydrolase family protein [Streptosporangiaceae bacterium]
MTLMFMPSLAARFSGALLGVHAGDSLGATLEFSSWAEIRKRYPGGLRDIVGGGPLCWPAGHATDDTDLTRAVLVAYLDSASGSGASGIGASGIGASRSRIGRKTDVVRAAANLMLAWLDGDWPGREPGSPPTDVGAATRAGLTRYRRGGDPRAAGAGDGHAGNGSLMRCIPTALAVTDRRRRISESIEISAITHDDERAVTACAAYNEIAAALVAGGAPDAAVAAGLETARELGSDQVAAAIEFGSTFNPADLAASGQLPFPAGPPATSSTRSAWQ